LTSTNLPPNEAKVLDFPTPKEAYTKPKTLSDWPWDMELGKPHMDINGPIDYGPVNPSPAALSLAKAISLIDGDRDKSHGDRHENFGMIAALWSTYLGKEIKPHQVAWCMVLMKAARESNGTHSLDNAIDAAGYAALAGELAE
jgi:hypothetical protein